NDQYGHQAGDQVLCAVADACRRQLRTYDLLGRYGGDEFVAILPETSLPDALAIADRLRQGVADTPTMIPSRPTLSIGVAEITDTRNLDALVARADIALYTAKNHGRDQAQPYTMA
ncbi:MAG TPA: GGDEF domain-containing protein, partial [Kineosporiaceae bacterium]|nr:GGDEF domain-containing protein [Kineosporiaceae bacterium]